MKNRKWSPQMTFQPERCLNAATRIHGNKINPQTNPPYYITIIVAKVTKKTVLTYAK